MSSKLRKGSVRVADPFRAAGYRWVAKTPEPIESNNRINHFLSSHPPDPRPRQRRSASLDHATNALDTDSVHHLDSTLLISGDDSTDSAYWGSSGSCRYSAWAQGGWEHPRRYPSTSRKMCHRLFRPVRCRPGQHRHGRFFIKSVEKSDDTDGEMIDAQQAAPTRQAVPEARPTGVARLPFPRSAYGIDQIADKIDRTSWAADLTWRQIESFAKYCQAYSIPAGEVIISQGDTAAHFCIVTTGRVRVSKRVAGKRKDIIEFGIGQSFGEMSLVDGEPRSASVTAVIDTEIVVMSDRDFAELREEVPRLAVLVLLRISRLISQRLRQTSGELVKSA